MSTPRRINGTAVVFNSETVIGYASGSFREMIAPGALDGLSLEDVRLLRDHEPSRIVARTTAGSLTLTKDRRGLHFIATMSNTADGTDLAELVDRGEVTGCSFMMGVSRDSWVADSRGTLRIVEEISYFPEISCVSFPAYPQSSVGPGASFVGDRTAVPTWVTEARVRLGMPASLGERAYVHPSRRPGTYPIPRPVYAKPLRQRQDVGTATARGALVGETRAAWRFPWSRTEPDGFDDRTPTEHLRDTEAEAGTVEIMAGIDPSGPWNAYRSLARSRGLSPDYVAAEAAADRLAAIVAMPVVER